MIKPGVCGICGVAVVQPEFESSGWHNGHLFENKLKPNQTKYSELTLVKVRCMTHKEGSDPRYWDYEQRGSESLVVSELRECSF